MYERPALELLRDCVLDQSTCRESAAVDVGANIGNHSLFFADLFARVIAFEPNPVTRSILKINLELNSTSNVEIRSAGLSDHAGTATLDYDLSNLGAASADASKATGSNQSVIHIEVGDEALAGIDRIAFVKIDVEGAEESVLKGLQQTLRVHSPVVMMEQWKSVIDEHTGTSPPVRILQSLGYDLWELRPQRFFGGRLGKLRGLLTGHIDYQLTKVERLEKREYPVLIFTPPSYVFPQPS